MPHFASTIPLSLYIHIPWCVSKCPYCDFNSHTIKGDLPEDIYINALLRDLTFDAPKVFDREIMSIFIGGGTPSVFSPQSIANLLAGVKTRLNLSADIEITLEANPGTFEQARFEGFREAGINRLSLGIQSFQPDKLKTLKRIHNASEAINAVEAAKKCGFSHFNLDLMFGLPQQTPEDALFDLQTAIKLNPTHLSWYQLTLEPKTPFYHRPPKLPDDDSIWEMQQMGRHFLEQHHLHQYEISAYSIDGHQCKHNRNYWEFGDYLGIGAGAHAKLTDLTLQTVTRFSKTKHPKNYLDPSTPFIDSENVISADELPLEFMMNALRLQQPIPTQWFTQRTGLPMKAIENTLTKASQQQLLLWEQDTITVTAMGRRYLNELLQLFL